MMLGRWLAAAAFGGLATLCGASGVLAAEAESQLESKHLHHIRQLTSGFTKAGEGYFSPDGKTIVYQAVPKGYPFYQIYKQPLSRQQFDDWMDTMKAASQAAPWPVSLSAHPRYFRDAPYKDWNFAQRLRDAGVREAVLMIYSSDPNKVAQISKPITGAATDLKFRIAQSVEPGLSEKESHARRSPADFEKNMRQLQDLLAAQDNTDGIAVQAWADLMRMGYESQIR